LTKLYFKSRIENVLGEDVTRPFFRKVISAMKKLRNIMAMALAVVMSLSLAIPAFAAEATEPAAEPAAAAETADTGIMPLYTNTTTVRTNGTWTTVARENSFGCNVTVAIPFFASLNYKVSIGYRTNYVQANPTVVADDAFGLNGNSKTIFVPSNAIAVEVRITSRDSIGGISSFNVNTTVNK